MAGGVFDHFMDKVGFPCSLLPNPLIFQLALERNNSCVSNKACAHPMYRNLCRQHPLTAAVAMLRIKILCCIFTTSVQHMIQIAGNLVKLQCQFNELFISDSAQVETKIKFLNHSQKKKKTPEPI